MTLSLIIGFFLGCIFGFLASLPVATVVGFRLAKKHLAKCANDIVKAFENAGNDLAARINDDSLSPIHDVFEDIRSKLNATCERLSCEKCGEEKYFNVKISDDGARMTCNKCGHSKDLFSLEEKQASAPETETAAEPK